MPLIPSNLDPLYRSKIEALIQDLGKKNRVLVQTETSVRCPNCIFDIVSKAGSGKYNGTGPTPFDGKLCPVCGNKGNVVTHKNTPLVANVIDATRSKDDGVLPEGGLAEGEAYLETFERYYTLLLRCKSVTINGIRYMKKGQPKRNGLQSNVTSYTYLKRSD